MKAPTGPIRFKEAQKLLDYGFSNYNYVKIGEKNEVVQQIQINKGVEDNINLVFEKTAGALIKKGQEKSIIQNISIEDNIQAPVNKGQKLGEITFTLDGNIIEAINLIAEKDIKKINIINMIGHIYNNWFKILR